MSLTSKIQHMCVLTISYLFSCFCEGRWECKSTKWIFALLATFCSEWHFLCSHTVTLKVLPLSQHVIRERMLVAQNYVTTIVWFRWGSSVYRRCIWEVRRWRWTGVVQRQKGWTCGSVPSKLCGSGVTVTRLLKPYTKCFLPKWNAGHHIIYFSYVAWYMGTCSAESWRIRNCFMQFYSYSVS